MAPLTRTQYESINEHVVNARRHGRQVIEYEFPKSHDYAMEPDVLADMNAVRQALTSHVSASGHPELAGALDAEHVCLRLTSDPSVTTEQRNNILDEYETVRNGIANYMRRLEQQVVPDAIAAYADAEDVSASPASEPAADDDNDEQPPTPSATPTLDALKRDLLTVIEDMVMEEHGLVSFSVHNLKVTGAGNVLIAGNGYDEQEQQRIHVQHYSNSRTLMNHILMTLFGG